MAPSSDERSARIRRLADEVRALDPQRRTAFLDRACPDDPDLREAVAALLRTEDGVEPPVAGLRDAYDLTGRTLGRYTRLERVGQGGMGVVYRARDTRLDRTVALKLLPPDRIANPESKARFLREARAAAALNHPHICTIYEIDQTDGQTYIAMEYVEGETLEDRLTRGPFDPETLLSFACDVADGLQAAHEAGIVHRDIKPANLMIDGRGRARITDFGLARLGSQEEALTRIGQTFGTLAYMSPEHIRGDALDHRTDLWAFGAVLYEMATGTRAFSGTYPEAIFYSVINTDPPALTGQDALPAGLAPIIGRCLEKDPDRRYPSAAALLTDLQRLRREDTPLPAAPAAVPRFRHIDAGRVGWSSRWVWALGGLLLLAVGLGLWTRQTSTEPAPPDPAVPTKRHIAVLPLENGLGPNPQHAAFAEGLMETMTSLLSRMEVFQEEFWVVPSYEVRNRAVGDDPVEAVRAFGVNLIVTGSLRVLGGDRVRVTLNLIDPAGPRQIDSEQIDVEQDNLLALQDALLPHLMDLLELTLEPQTRARAATGGTTVPGAYELYVTGLGYMNRFDQTQNIDTAIRQFEGAIREDSTYALAHAALGEAYWMKYSATEDTQWVSRAARQAERAATLADTLAAVHLANGFVHRGMGRYRQAAAAYTRALELEPNNATAHRGLGRTYEAQGRNESAERSYRRAIALQPDNWLNYNELGIFYIFQGRYGDAADQFEQVTRLTPDNYVGYLNQGVSLMNTGRPEEAEALFRASITHQPSWEAYDNLGALAYRREDHDAAARMYEQALGLDPNKYEIWSHLANVAYWVPARREQAHDAWRRVIDLAEPELAVNPGDQSLLSNLAEAYVMTGDTLTGTTYLERLLAVQSRRPDILYQIGLTYEKLGKRNLALLYIEQALENGLDPVLPELSRWLLDLRADPAYTSMRARVLGDVQG